MLATAGAAKQEIGVSMERPHPLFNRWQEDWSRLANPVVPAEPLDALKYAPFDRPDDYLSFGLTQRLRYELNDIPGLGLTGARADDYFLSRTELHADLRLQSVQAFVQLESVLAPGKVRLAPSDENRLDVEQAFVAGVRPVPGGVLKARIGRQQFAFDLQRFVSVRDGPNVRQSFDGAWFDFETPRWRLIGYWTQPVVARDARPFDDRSSDRWTFSGVRIERRVFGDGELSAYWSRFRQEGATYGGVRGTDDRHVFDARFAGSLGPIDWDLEAMGQVGGFAGRDIRAWGFGARFGRAFKAQWQPRFGLQLDGASGDGDPRDRKLTTFNPLFPNGAYLTLAGYTGYANFLHLKPSMTVHPTPRLAATFAIATQWRMTTADAVYVQPSSSLMGTAGRAGKYTGAYGQVRFDYLVSPHLTAALEAVRFETSRSLKTVGARSADYLGVELKFAW